MNGETVIQRFKRLRKAADLSQSQLAAQTGLSPGTIGDIERGRQSLGKYIDLLATALRTTPEHLRSGDEPTAIPKAMLSPPRGVSHRAIPVNEWPHQDTP